MSAYWCCFIPVFTHSQYLFEFVLHGKQISVGGVKGLNSTNKDTEASSAPLWITALILLLSKQTHWSSDQHPLCSNPFIMLIESQLPLADLHSTLVLWVMCTLYSSLLLFSASVFTLLNKPTLPGGSVPCSFTIKTKFITSAKGHSLFSLRVFPAVVAAAACHHTVTLQMEPGIHIIKT